MTIRTVYVRAKSKAAINRELLVNQHAFECIEHSTAGAEVYDLENMPTGTVVKVYSKEICGIPYAKAYGTVKRFDGKVFVV